MGAAEYRCICSYFLSLLENINQALNTGLLAWKHSGSYASDVWSSRWDHYN